jgi:hypothetical protein
MGRIWFPGNVINAFAIPHGAFISHDIEMIRLREMTNNSKYRANLEKAGKMAGYTDKGLILTAKAAKVKGEDALFRQNIKAELLLKRKKEHGNAEKIIVPGAN